MPVSRRGAGPVGLGVRARSGRGSVGASSGLLVLVGLALVAGSVSLGDDRARSADGSLVVAPADPGQLAVYLGALAGGPPRPGAGRAADRPGPPADGRDARRDRAAAHGAAAAGPGRVGVSATALGPGRRPARLAARRARDRRRPGDRRPIGHLAAPLQVHLGGGRDRPPAPDVRPRRGGQRRPADPPDRAVQRPADRAAQGHPGRLPGGLPVGVPAAPRRGEHPDRAAPPAARAVPRCRWSRCGPSPSGSSWSSATSARRSCSSPSSCAALRGDRAGRLRRHRAGPARRRRRSPPTACSATSGSGSTSGCDPFADPSGAGYQVVQALDRVRPGRHPRDRARGRPAARRRAAADPGDPHRLPARGPRRGARPDRDPGDPRAVPRGHRARPADRRVGGRRLPGAAGGRAGPRRRGPGVHHRGRQPQAHPADRDHPAVHQLRRLVAARQRGRRRAAAGALGPRRRAAAAAAPGRRRFDRLLGGASRERDRAARARPARPRPTPIGGASSGSGSSSWSRSRSWRPGPATGRSSGRPTSSAGPTTRSSSPPPGTSSGARSSTATAPPGDLEAGRQRRAVPGLPEQGGRAGRSATRRGSTGPPVWSGRTTPS